MLQIEQNSNICRICLNVQDTLFSLYRKRHGTSPYEKLISRTKLAIQLNDSGPPSICSQCLIDLDTTVSFLDKCERSSLILSARFAQGLNVENEECSNYKTESDEVKSGFTEYLSALNTKVDDDEPIMEERCSDEKQKLEKCPECGSRRRCRHRSHTRPSPPHSCPHCHKTFNKKYNCQIHIKRHLGTAEWACGVCGARCSSRWASRRHCPPRAPALARRPCPAPSCGKTFTTNTNLRIHIRTHSGEKPFGCDDCGKTFISKNILNNHMRIHTGVKPYMCQICGKQFTTNKLAAHMLSHGGAPARRVHACLHAGCTRAFRTPRALHDHARAHSSHKAYACALCSAAYKYKQSLNYHVKHAHGVAVVMGVAKGTNPVDSTDADASLACPTEECEM